VAQGRGVAMTTTLRAPFPWFGGKSRAAALIWERFGDVANYVEPFAGSLAVLLARPHGPRVETVNDRDAYLANLWRAVQADPKAVARHCDWPVNEADLHARHRWLLAQADFREKMLSDPHFYDAKIAGWWVWGVCSWIGTGWCDVSRGAAAELPHLGNPGQGVHRKLPHLGNPGQGVHRKLPHLGDGGRGGHRAPARQLPHLSDAGVGGHRPPQQLPHLGNPGRGDSRPARQLPRLDGSGAAGDAGSALGDLTLYFLELAARLRRVRVACGDWSRVVGPSVLRSAGGVTGVLLDPPYADGDMSYSAGGRGISAEVRTWALEHGDDPDLRIALCGYEGEHEMPASWECVSWKARGGYGSQGDGSNDNAHRERIWFSPGCLGARQPSLFGGAL
jgi:hypothetical protein